MIKLGIMQGRLVKPIKNKIQAFPIEEWPLEFKYCNILGLECIEWVFEYETCDQNPILFKDGIQQIQDLSDKYNVAVNSLIADYFMEKKLFGANKIEKREAISMIYLLIDRCKECGIKLLEIPLVDNSALVTERDKEDFIANMAKPLEYAKQQNISIGLETSLPPQEFTNLIESFKPYEVQVNYDMGNSTSLTYNPNEEFKLLGKHISNVHIKDRIVGGGTVPLGNGDTDFNLVFKLLKSIAYDGDLILQAARKDLQGLNYYSSPIETVTGYIQFCTQYLEILK